MLKDVYESLERKKGMLVRWRMELGHRTAYRAAQYRGVTSAPTTQSNFSVTCLPRGSTGWLRKVGVPDYNDLVAQKLKTARIFTTT